MIKQVCKEGSEEQREFERCISMYENYRSLLSKNVDCTNPQEILQHFTDLSGALAIGVLCKAKLQELTDKLSVKYMMSLNSENLSEADKKVKLAFSIGDCSFYNVAMEMLIKSSYAKIEMLKYSLQFSKK